MVQGQLFDGFHLTYILVSTIITVLLLYIPFKYIKKQDSKNLYLNILGWVTIISHMAIMWYDFLAHGEAHADSSILFPIYFCNVMMYMLLVCAAMNKKDTKIFKIVATITAYGGIIGATISLIYPDYYLTGQSNLDFGIWKSMISHSFLFIGSMWLFLGGYVKPRLANVIWYNVGLVCIAIMAYTTNFLWAIFLNLDANAMWSHHPAIEGTIFNGYVMGILSILLVGLVGLLFELRLPKEEQVFQTKKLELFE